MPPTPWRVLPEAGKMLPEAGKMLSEAGKMLSETGKMPTDHVHGMHPVRRGRLSGMPKTAAARTPRSTPKPTDPPMDFDACVKRATAGRDTAGLIEAGELYGADIQAEMAAVAAGTHPLQRRAAGRRRAQR